MKYYYDLAIEKGEYWAAHNIGIYHKRVSHNYDEMEKYYKIAIEKGNLSGSMNNLGHYHQNITKNYSEMKKYYDMALRKNDALAMLNYGKYHHYVTGRKNEMLQYFVKALKYGNTRVEKKVYRELADVFKNEQNRGELAIEFLDLCKHYGLSRLVWRIMTKGLKAEYS